MDVMMMLGDYAFGLDAAAFQELNRSTEWRWPSQDVFEGRPVLQYTGQGRDTLTLPGVIFPEYWGGTDQLDQLRDLGDSGELQTLIDGRGNILGSFVVTSVQERQSIFGAAGVARRQEFTITLDRQSDDALAGPLDTVVSAVVASPPAAPSLLPGAGTVDGLAGAISSASATAGSAVASLSAIQAANGSAPQAILGKLGAAITSARALQAEAGNALAQVRGLSGVPSLVAAMGAVSGLLNQAASTTQMATGASGAISSLGGPLSAVAGVGNLAVQSAAIAANVAAMLKGFS